MEPKWSRELDGGFFSLTALPHPLQAALLPRGGHRAQLPERCLSCEEESRRWRGCRTAKGQVQGLLSTSPMSHHCNQNQPFPELRGLFFPSPTPETLQRPQSPTTTASKQLSKLPRSSINQTCSSPFQVLVLSYRRQNPTLISFLLLPTLVSFLPVFPNLLHILLFQEVLLDWSLSSLGKHSLSHHSALLSQLYPWDFLSQAVRESVSMLLCVMG